ncbi:MAG: hypothetical protein KGI02_08455 [Thaumarchaeota archaeon]|nr:hypothetical protein [Nitrososphaerota archaeon]MDE1832383.1 hypothetical protein [Nitrososphaerota archaeon]
MKTKYLAIMIIPVCIVILSIVPNPITTVSTIFHVKSSSNEKPFPYAYGDCFQGCGQIEENFPPASVGNRTIDLAIKLYSNSTMPDDTHYIWFRFFDKNTNQTIRHVSFFITITKQDHILFRDLLHTHTGILNTKVISTAGPKWNVTADHEPILNGWAPYNDDEPIIVQAPLFNDYNSTYHLNVQMFSIDRDNNIFDSTDNPYSVPNFDLSFGMKDQNRTIILNSVRPLPIKTGYFQTVTGSSPVNGYLWLGEKLFVQTVAENISPQWQNFTYITEVFDNSGRVEGIQWHNLQLNPGQSNTLSNSWTPYRQGNYTIDSFVWGNFTDNPVPIANSMKASVEVRR